METNQQRRCSRCGESGHNIRSCILDLDKRIIEEYSQNSFTEFPTLHIENKLNKLCQKYGLSITNITDNQKKERLHNIYLTLGRQHALNQILQRQRQTSLYRPSYLPPPPPPSTTHQTMIMAYLSLFYLQGIDLGNGHGHGRTNQSQNRRHIPSVQIVVDPSKFTKNIDEGDCPVCYEECGNMIITDCNHSYCQPCISSYMNTINKNILPCPLCRENIKNVFVFSETSSDLMLQI